MNFINDALNSVPVVGHVKGVLHYVVGDTEGGNEAMYQSTRTSAVLAGGTAGALGGPAGAAFGAVYAGVITDAVAGVASNEPKGVIKSFVDISDNMDEGKNPIGSIATTGALIAFDGITGGIGGSAASIL